MEIDISKGLKLKGGYIIVPSPTDYVLYQRVKSRERGTKELRFDENGKQIYAFRRIGYYTTIPSALRRYREELIKRKLSDAVVTLEQYIEILNEVNETFEKAMERLEHE